MKFEPCSAIIYSKSLYEAKRVLQKKSTDGLGNAHLQAQGDGYLLFLSNAPINTAAPFIAEQLQTEDHALFVTLIADKEIYILIKDGVESFSEYFITISTQSSVDIKKLMTHLFRLGERISTFKVFSDIEHRTTSKGHTAFNDEFELPVDASLVTDVKWIKALEDNLLLLRSHKTIDVIRAGAQKRNLVAMGILTLTGLGVGLNIYSDNLNEKIAATPEATNTKVEMVENTEAKPFISYLTTSGHNTLDSLQNFTKKMNIVNTLVSWEPTEINLKALPNGYISMKVKLSPVHESNTSEIISFAGKNGFSTSLSSEAAVITTVLDSRPILRKAYKFHIGTFEHLISKSVNAWWDDVTVKVNRPEDKEGTTFQNWREHVIDIGIKSVDTFDVASVGGLLTGLPIGFESMHATKADPMQPRWDATFKFKLIGVQYND